MSGSWLAALLVVSTVPTVSVPMMRGACEIESAWVVATLPSTFQVLEVQSCGARLCFERYTITNGQRVRAARSCSVRDGLYQAAPEGEAIAP